MKKHIFVAIMVFTILILLLNIITINKNYSHLAKDIRIKFKEDSIVISELSGRIRLLSQNSNFEIEKKTILINENNDSIRLDDIKFSKYLFIIRFSEMNCLNCITQEMQHVAKFLESNKNVICLATYSRQVDLINNKKLMHISFPIYNISFDKFNNEMEKRKLPYYFIIDRNYRVKSLFVADPNNYKLTDKYLDYVNALFNEPL